MRIAAALLIAAIVLTGIVLGAGLAHLLAMPNKMGLAREDYLVAQQVYRGWAFVGVPLYLDMIVILLAAWRMGATDGPVGWALLALGFLVLGQIVFWIWTYPANVATAQWTTLPKDWEVLRRQWEISHAAGALCSLAALFSLAVAAVKLR
ncbi:MAG TPA: DUF1772 domain-containing protein [Xanthobacteraceae bacterium]|jgi:hypothetical protein|nr:DUF1772 domain-containing protein [Xanthobacteraceae bacterium]